MLRLLSLRGNGLRTRTSEDAMLVRKIVFLTVGLGRSEILENRYGHGYTLLPTGRHHDGENDIFTCCFCQASFSCK